MLKSNFKIGFIVFLSVLILFNSQTVMQSVKDGLLLCYNSVIPALYIFMVLSKYISSNTNGGLLSLPFNGYRHIMQVKDKKYCLYILLSLLGGFAVGATFLKEMKDKGYCKNSILSSAPVMINNSLSFCVMAVGAGCLGNVKTGWLLFISLTAASMIAGFILSFIYRYDVITPFENNVSSSTGIVECINSSVNSIISICGFVVLFYVLCKVFSLYILSDAVSTVLCIFTEVSCGCSEIINIYGKNPYFLCFALSVLPVSTLCQVYYFTKNTDVIKSLILSRFIHTPLSIFIFHNLLNIFPYERNVLAPTGIAVKSYYSTMEISTTLFMITLCLICIFDNNKLFTKLNF